MTLLFVALIAAILIVVAFFINRYFAGKGERIKGMIYPSIVVGGSMGLLIGIIGEGTPAGIVLAMITLSIVVFIQMFVIHRITKLLIPKKKEN